MAVVALLLAICPLAREAIAHCDGSWPTNEVVAGDLDADGRYTGNDLALALKQCAAQKGCVLHALAQPYDDVSILLDPTGWPDWCRMGSFRHCLTLSFPRGLVIQGEGVKTVFRSPLWTPPYRPSAVLEFMNAGDTRIAVRDLVLDGRKDEQRDPEGPGVNRSHAWWHYGLQIWNRNGSPAEGTTVGGCISKVEARNFQARGIALGNARNWTIENNFVHDIGCQRGFRRCSALTITGQSPPAANANPDSVISGYGILIGMHVEDLSIVGNRIERVTKYSIGLKHGTDGSETSIKQIRIRNNVISDAGKTGIFMAGCEDIVVENNRIESTRLGPEPASMANHFNTMAISALAKVRGLRIARNRIVNSAGISLHYDADSGDTTNVVVDNWIEGSCHEKNPAVCADPTASLAWERKCFLYADVGIGRQARGKLELRGNRILGSQCARAIQVGRTDADALHIRLDGKRILPGDPIWPVARIAD